MISALQWVPRGAVKQKPQRYELSEEEARMLAERYVAVGYGHRLRGGNSQDFDFPVLHWCAALQGGCRFATT
jgi:hypothetical protein